MIASASVQSVEFILLFQWVLGVCGGIFLIVWVAVFLCGRRFAARGNVPGERHDPPLSR